MLDNLRKAFASVRGANDKIVKRLLQEGAITFEEAVILLEKKITIHADIDVSSGAIVAGGDVERIESGFSQ